MAGGGGYVGAGGGVGKQWLLYTGDGVHHRVARKHDKAKTLGVPTHRLGLSEPLELGYKPRHHVLDGYHLAMAARALEELGLNSGRGVLIGQDRNLAFYTDTATYQCGFGRGAGCRGAGEPAHPAAAGERVRELPLLAFVQT